MKTAGGFLEFERNTVEGVFQYSCVGLDTLGKRGQATQVIGEPIPFCQYAAELSQASLPGFPSDTVPDYISSLNVGSAGVTNLFYLAFIWRATEGFARFLSLPGYRLKEIRRYLPSAMGDSVRWEYRLWERPEDYLWKLDETGPTTEFFGFSRSPQGHGDGTPRATLISLSSFLELLAFQAILLADVSCEMVLYAIKRDRYNKLLETLHDEPRPKLKTVLGADGLLVDYVCGVDLGYWHAIQILSSRDAEEVLLKLNCDFLRASRQYSDSIGIIDPTTYQEFVLGLLRI